MKCIKCENESVKIKGKHFCPSCGSKVNPTIIKSTVVRVEKQKNVEPTGDLERAIDTPKVDVDTSVPDAFSVSDINSSESVSKNRIKELVDENTEPKKVLGKTSTPKRVMDIGKNNSKVVANKTNYMAAIFSKKSDSELEGKESVKSVSQSVPTKKEKVLKIILIAVIVLNMFFIGGIVYMVVTQ